MHMSCGAKFIHTQQESCHVMPWIVAHAENTNDAIHASHGTCIPASQPFLDKYYVPEILICLPFMQAE